MSPGEILKRNKHSDCIVLKSENTGDKGWWERTLEHKQWNCKTNGALRLSGNLPRNPSCKLSDMRQSAFTAKVKGPELQLQQPSTRKGISCGCLCPMGISVRKHIPLSCGGEEREWEGLIPWQGQETGSRQVYPACECKSCLTSSKSLCWKLFRKFIPFLPPFGLSVARCLWERGSTFWSTPK